MKITKQCSECGGREIYTTDGMVDGNTRNLLPGLAGFLQYNSGVKIYVCGQCGHYQLFLDDATLAKVKETYKLHT